MHELQIADTAEHLRRIDPKQVVVTLANFLGSDSSWVGYDSGWLGGGGGGGK